MSLFDSASLVVTPNGYKEDKLYSIKPTDGSGDLVVTRATTATRVNSAGLIEEVPYNFVTNSQDFLTGWATNASPTITANASTAPDGTTTADNFLTSASASGVYQVPTVSSGVTYTFSVYIKNISNATNIRIGCDLNPSTGFVDYNAVTNTIYSTGGAIISSSVESVGNGWYRIKGSYNSTGTQNTLIIFSISSSTFNYSVWGAQLVSGTSAKEYFPTTDRLNVPRLDYTNSSCPSILVEPQRTNLITYSEQFDNAAWSKFQATITANSTTSLDGSTNADTITDDTNSGLHVIFRSAWNTTTQTFTIFAKAGTSSRVCILNASLGTGVFANLSNNTIVVDSGFVGTLTPFGNGWFRITATHTAGSSQTLAVGLFTGTSTSEYVGTGSTAYIWGAQLEAGSYATSYIPTVASSVTRNADVISKTGISSLIGQTEGTLFLDFYYSGLADNHMIINDSSFTSYIYINSQIAGQLWGQIQNIGIQFSTIATAGRYKCALAYKSGNSAFYVNGVQVGTSATAFSLSNNIATLDYTISTPKNNINASALWKTRLSNTELASLTTI